jgi:heat shock protein HslJ
MASLHKASQLILVIVSISLFSCNTSNTENSDKNTSVDSDQTQSQQTIVLSDNVKRDLIGKWQVEYIAKRPVMDKSPAQIVFLTQGKLTGSASCNNFISTYTIDKHKKLSVTPAITTRKMCFKALMEQEQRFINLLTKVSDYRIEFDILYLSDKENNQLFKASRTQ